MASRPWSFQRGVRPPILAAVATVCGLLALWLARLPAADALEFRFGATDPPTPMVATGWPPANPSPPPPQSPWRPPGIVSNAPRTAPGSIQPLPDSFGQAGHELWNESLYILGAPLRWRARAWVECGLTLAALSATVLFVDHKMDRYNRGPNRSRERSFWTHVSDWGIAVPMVILGGHGLIGYAYNLPFAQRVFLDAVEATLITTGLVVFFKFIIGRSFPDETSDALVFRPFNNGWDTGIPSGHTATAFVTAGVLAASYAQQPWVGVLALSVAGGVGFSRLYLHEHWVSDVFAGGILGAIIAWDIVFRHRGWAGGDADAEAAGWWAAPTQVRLMVRDDIPGMALCWAF